MNGLMSLAATSAWNRRGTLALVAASIALATLLLLGVERIRHDVRENFSRAVSGTDLVVGARTGAVQLMLYAVFHVGGASNDIKTESLAAIAQHRAVAWVVPLSLGDSHRGFPVLGTTPAFFEHFHHGDRESLRFAQGQAFSGELDGLYGAVLGAEVARRLGYGLGTHIVLAHGGGEALGAEHADKPFTVVGILAPTGTPVDRTVHIDLKALEAIHLDWAGGAPLKGLAIPPEMARKFDLTPREVSAALVGLKGRAAVFAVQRFVNQYEGEPLLAVLPGVALDELWDVVGVGERVLLLVAALVGLVSLAGLVATVLAGLNERRRELALLRAVGAAPRHVLLLLALEGTLVTLAGIALGLLLTVILSATLGPWAQAQYGVALRIAAPTGNEALLLAAVLAAGVLASLVPGWRAWRLSLADGLSPRI